MCIICDRKKGKKEKIVLKNHQDLLEAQINLKEPESIQVFKDRRKTYLMWMTPTENTVFIELRRENEKTRS